MKRARILALAEDQRHERFVRQFLYKLGYNSYDIHFEIAPPGRGSGEQFVRDNYLRVAKIFRNRSATAQTGLVVVIDADSASVSERHQQFESILREAGQAPRVASEEWACLVARRNIETWILCLCDHTVSEQSNYRSDGTIDALLREASSSFYSWTRPNAAIPPHCVDSLRQAIPEAQRIQPK